MTNTCKYRELAHANHAARAISLGMPSGPLVWLRVRYQANGASHLRRNRVNGRQHFEGGKPKAPAHNVEVRSASEVAIQSCDNCASISPDERHIHGSLDESIDGVAAVVIHARFRLRDSGAHTNLQTLAFACFAVPPRTRAYSDITKPNILLSQNNKNEC